MLSKNASRGRRSGHASGMTLLEMLIAIGIAVIVLGGLLRMGGSTQKAWDTVSKDCNANFDLRRAVDRMADELRQSAPSRVAVDHTGVDADMVTFRVPVNKALDVVLYGAEGNSNWYVRYVVENGQLIRRVLTDTQANAGDQVLVTNVDGNMGGNKGFAVTVSGNMVSIDVRATVRSNGETWRKEATTSVLFRNE